MKTVFFPQKFDCVLLIVFGGCCIFILVLQKNMRFNSEMEKQWCMKKSTALKM